MSRDSTSSQPEGEPNDRGRGEGQGADDQEDARWWGTMAGKIAIFTGIVTLLAAAIALLQPVIEHWLSNDEEGGSASPSASLTPGEPTVGPGPEQPSADETEEPSGSPDAAQDDAPPGEEDPIIQLDKYLIDPDEITVGDNNYLDIDGHRLNGTGRVNEFELDFGRLFFDPHFQEGVSPNVKIGVIDSVDLPHCASKARFEDHVLHLSEVEDALESICVQTSAGKWAMLNVVGFTRSASGIGASEIRFRYGMLKDPD
ncbi:hypothetical protein ACWDN6_30005 [Streptomyces albogriseolus]|uniref:hypothetical protein n=2 Tax=Streptomyces TaxID=1883 RepID=UPI00142F67AA|nr:hypothetical protein [Streptomyces sp. 2BBP-J2]NIL50499.1 hypothetical protein [Streptomyces sp. 2BBP-J2]